jgi:hypothetical protein
MLQETETLDLKLVKLIPHKGKWISRNWNPKNPSLPFVFSSPVHLFLFRSSFPLSCSSSFDSCSWVRLVINLFLLLFAYFTRKWSRYLFTLVETESYLLLLLFLFVCFDEVLKSTDNKQVCCCHVVVVL